MKIAKPRPCYTWMLTNNYKIKSIQICIELDETTNEVVSKEVSMISDKLKSYRHDGMHAKCYETLEEALSNKPRLIDESDGSWLVEESVKYGEYDAAFVYSKEGRHAYLLVKTTYWSSDWGYIHEE